jgi:hypothetical protein
MPCATKSASKLSKPWPFLNNNLVYNATSKHVSEYRFSFGLKSLQINCEAAGWGVSFWTFHCSYSSHVWMSLTMLPNGVLNVLYIELVYLIHYIFRYLWLQLKLFWRYVLISHCPIVELLCARRSAEKYSHSRVFYPFKENSMHGSYKHIFTISFCAKHTNKHPNLQ